MERGKGTRGCEGDGHLLHEKRHPGREVVVENWEE